MGPFETEGECAITYMPDNHPSTIAKTITDVVRNATYENLAQDYVTKTYNISVVSNRLNDLLHEAVSYFQNSIKGKGSL